MKKRIHKLGTLLLTMSILFSCGKDDAPTTEPVPKNTAPEMESQTFKVNENIEQNKSFGNISAEDAEDDALTFSLVKDESNLFSVSGNGGISLVEGGSLDFETVKKHLLTVRVSDGNSNVSAEITISVQNVNEAPTFDENTIFQVAENIADTFVIGTVKATDPENATLDYRISENDNGLFEINTDGELSLVKDQMLDFEAANSHEITVTVSDGEQSTSALITINVIKFDPDNTAPTMEDQSFEVNEDIAASVSFATITAEDAEENELTFSLTADESKNFTVADNGEISLVEGASLDFETLKDYDLTVQVTDGNSATEAYITISVQDVNETPVTEPELQFNVSEDINDMVIIGTITATDPENNVLTYSISENDNELFEISETGEISLAPNKVLDYEAQTEHTVQISVADEEFISYVDVTITIENIADSLSEDPASFVTKWKTEVDGESIEIGVKSGMDYDFVIDWGDGTGEHVMTNAQMLESVFTHVYEEAGTYTVAIKGEFPAIRALTGTEKNLVSIEQWGGILWKTMDEAFRLCSNMVYHASDVPNLQHVTSMNGMFRQTDLFNGDLNNWNVSNVTDMGGLFNGAIAFNGAIGDWNVSNVTDMSHMFAFAESFNREIGNWETQNVTTMLGMFGQAYAFNQDIGNWNVGKVTDMNMMFSYAVVFNQDLNDWSVGNVTDMDSMFSHATAFDGNISNWNTAEVTKMYGMFSFAKSFNQDIGGWNVSKVLSMSEMFEKADSFNQDISNWNTSEATGMVNMFADAIAFDQNLGSWDIGKISGNSMIEMFSRSGMSPENMNATLIGWANYVELHLGPSEVGLGLKEVTICGAETAAALDVLMNDYSWNITGFDMQLDLCP